MSVVVEVACCRIGLLGFGRIGQAVAALAASSSRLSDRGVDAQLVTALVRDPEKPRAGARIPLSTSAHGFFDRPLDLVIEVMGGVDPAYAYVRQALESGIPVVTANKSLMAAKGEELRSVAAGAGVALAYDAAVLAGVPFIGPLARRPFAGTPRRITGILNGTSHYLTCALASGRSFSDALTEAVERGYAEPDSSADVSGRDAAEKLAILLQLAGCRDLTAPDLPSLGLDQLVPADFAAATALGAAIKPVAMASLDPADAGAWVGPALIDENHAAARTRGVHNFVEFSHSDSSAQEDDELPVTFAGPGAGPRVTAATILDDVAEIAAGVWTTPRLPWRAQVCAADLRRPPTSGWFLRVTKPSLPVGLPDLAEHLSAYRVPAIRAVRTADALAVRTAPAPWAVIRNAADVLAASGADVRVLPVIEGRR